MPIIRIPGKEDPGPSPAKHFTWIDAADPTEEELRSLGAELGIPEEWTDNCLLPNHLPILEGQKFPFYLVLRAYDPEAEEDADTMHTLTRKTVFFVMENAVLSVHRKDLPFFRENRAYWLSAPAITRSSELTKDVVLGDLLLGCLESYLVPLNDLDRREEELELNLLQHQQTRQLTKEVFALKRKLSTLKRLLRMTHDVLIKSTSRLQLSSANEALVKERAQSLFFTADELMESLDTTVNQMFTIDAQKTNDSMRALTMYSFLLLPLNLAAGLLGMNFEVLPLTKDPNGFWKICGGMLVFTVVVFLFRLAREKAKHRARAEEIRD